MRKILSTIPLAALLALAATGCEPGRPAAQAARAGTGVDTAKQVRPVPRSGSDLAASTPGFTFKDAGGRAPLNLVVQRGRRVSAVFLDSAVTALPATAARAAARSTAERLWKEIGQPQRTDTVSVAFTNRDKITADRITRLFFFYPADLPRGK